MIARPTPEPFSWFTPQVQYQFAHRKPMNVGAAAQLLSNTLYLKRFFPYYTANLCCGLDKDGKGGHLQLHLN